MKYGVGKDPYLDENGVLTNKLGAKTWEALDFAESLFASRKMVLLLNNPIEGSFDLEHLCYIHRYLFEDIYPWAGEIRQISISKGTSYFAMPDRIEAEAQKLFAKLSGENYLKGLSKEVLAERLAFYLGEINVLHPFREGNGRTQRIFIVQLAQQAGYVLHFQDISAEEMIEASIAANFVNYQPLQAMILARLEKL
ncbi:cell filamentation protein Fic [Pasteurellaceae bacterium RH1A]|nr:cell filamentation protein Fic [Pasteurellaceae bacterium RH1A]